MRTVSFPAVHVIATVKNLTIVIRIIEDVLRWTQLVFLSVLLLACHHSLIEELVVLAGIKGIALHHLSLVLITTDIVLLSVDHFDLLKLFIFVHRVFIFLLIVHQDRILAVDFVLHTVEVRVVVVGAH